MGLYILYHSIMGLFQYLQLVFRAITVPGWWFGTWLLFFHSVGNGKITPTDFHSIIFQRGRYATNQMIIHHH